MYSQYRLETFHYSCFIIIEVCCYESTKKSQPKPKQNFKENIVLFPEMGEFNVCHKYKIKLTGKAAPLQIVTRNSRNPGLLIFLERICTTADLTGNILEILLSVPAMESKY